MEDRLLTISEFSRLSGIPRKTLIFYDTAGVFSPAAIGKGRYRLYAPRQLQVAAVIVALRAIDVSLDEITAFLRKRSPDKLVTLCDRQEERITAEIAALQTIRNTIQSLNQTTQSAAEEKPGTLEIRTLPAARLFMGPPVPANDMDGISDALAEFYELCASNNIPSLHPLGSLTDIHEPGRKPRFRPLRFYCPAAASVPRTLVTLRPAGKYLVGHGTGDYGALVPLYMKMRRYLRSRNLTASSDAYEEYLLGEMARTNPDSYLARVCIRIR